MKNLNIRELILETSPPFEWNIENHPIQDIGHYLCGMADGFRFDTDKINNAKEEDLWRLYALINKYWLDKYQKWSSRTDNMIINMKHIEITKENVGKNLLDVYEAKYINRTQLKTQYNGKNKFL